MRYNLLSNKMTLLLVLMCLLMVVEQSQAGCSFCGDKSNAWNISPDRLSATLKPGQTDVGLTTCDNPTKRVSFCISIENNVESLIGVVNSDSKDFFSGKNGKDTSCWLNLKIGTAYCLKDGKKTQGINKQRKFEVGDNVCVVTKKGRVRFLKNFVDIKYSLKLDKKKKYVMD